LSVLVGQSVAAVVETIFYTLALQGLTAIQAFAAARRYNLVVN
jgi:hypothetical protein